MYTRLLTYDLYFGNSDDYTKLYDYLREIKAERLTESSYLIKTGISFDEMCTKLFSLTHSKDKVFLAYINTEYHLCAKTIR